MTKTEHYQLNQWESSDPIRRSDFNSDNAAIDAALKAVADTANGKASAESVTALQQSVNSQIAALSTALGSGGSNCRIMTGSYTGNGKAGSANPTTLTFAFQPLVVFVSSAEYGESTMMISGATETFASEGYCTVAWSGNRVSWYDPDGNSGTQLNASGAKYVYVCCGS